LFVAGAASPADDVLDLCLAGVLTYLLGWHWEFLPSFLGKLVPGVDFVPLWTLAVANVYRKSKQLAVIAERQPTEDTTQSRVRTEKPGNHPCLVQLRTAVCGIGHSFGSRTVGAALSVDTLHDSEEPPHNKNHGASSYPHLSRVIFLTAVDPESWQPKCSQSSCSLILSPWHDRRR
jgi:hypothetical protein